MPMFACRGRRCYTVIDDNRSGDYSYDSEGCLLYAFGGPDTDQPPVFVSPNSIAQSEEYLYVLDNSTHAVTMLRVILRQYGRKAIAAQENGEYARYMECWQKVLEL